MKSKNLPGITPRARHAMRKRVVRALANAKGPETVTVIRNPDGSFVLAPQGAYLWRGTLPNGEPFAFTTETPALEYAGLIDVLTDRLLYGRRGWAIVEHSPACREAGVGCICQPGIARNVTWEEL
jgi:hypothetical protein